MTFLWFSVKQCFSQVQVSQKLEVWAKNLGSSSLRKPLFSAANDVQRSQHFIMWPVSNKCGFWTQVCLPFEWIEINVVNVARHLILDSHQHLSKWAKRVETGVYQIDNGQCRPGWYLTGGSQGTSWSLTWAFRPQTPGGWCSALSP